MKRREEDRQQSPKFPVRSTHLISMMCVFSMSSPLSPFCPSHANFPPPKLLSRSTCQFNILRPVHFLKFALKFNHHALVFPLPTYTVLRLTVT